MNLKVSEKKEIDANKIVTGRTCIIGQSGSGKSYAIAVICEELLKNNIGFCIIDTEGEYFSLKEKYPLLWVGADSRCDLNLEKTDITLLAKKSIREDISVVLDVSEVEKSDDFVKKFMSAAYNIGSSIKKPYLIIIEEADKFIPQSGKYMKEIEEISKRGRKRGVGLALATQRPASVNKNILSQCNNQIIGKISIKNDLDAVKLFFPDKNDLKKIPELNPGEFFVQGNISSKEIIKFRKRETHHFSETPRIVPKENLTDARIESIKKEIESDEEEIEDIKVKCITPELEEEEAFKIIKKASKGVLKRKTVISKIHFLLRPFYSCEIKYLKKRLFKRDFETITCYFDAVDGGILSVSKGYSKIHDMENFIGLNQNDVEVFRCISKKKRSTSEIAYELNKSPETIRNSLKNLIERNIIRVEKMGRSNIYSRFTKSKLPSMKVISQKPMDFQHLKLKGKTIPEKVTVNDFREIIRGLFEKAEIVKEEKIYYPFYKSSYVRGKKQKDIILDAVTKKKIRKLTD